MAKSTPRVGITTPLVTVGDVSPREIPESREVTREDGTALTIIKDGVYTDLMPLLPVRGQASSDAPGFNVVSAKLVRRRGGLGRLTIDLAPREYFGGSFSDVILESNIEVDFIQYDRPLLTHPTLLKGDLPMADDLILWMNEPNAELKRTWYYHNANGSEDQLTDTEVRWAQKILRGIESFLEFAPVIRRVTTCGGRPEVEAPGSIETPPYEVGNYKYLKTADRLVQNNDKTWTRTEEWTGANDWDQDIYGEQA